ncbi:MAG: RagB/SusD family nutrient uptake outer membrane protein [Bacteroidaceae bacterium]|nr:RagB/SusD family nutrient uptake outer membrane protein [Bacteroidaceae bacterium]
MKKLNKSIMGLAAIAASTFALTSCVEETFPTDIATDEIVAASSAATEGLANGMPAYLVDVWTTDNHIYFGYPAEMIIRDACTGDKHYFGETGYSRWSTWSRCQYLGDGYLNTQFHWNYYYGFLGSVNGVIRAIDEESASEGPLAYLATAYAYRALIYLDLARMFEFLPNEKFPDGKNAEGNVVTNLTVPIVRHDITEEESKNNPRVTRDSMYNFILADLDKAEKYIVNLPNNADGALPDLSCVYGLKARLYMWVEDYANAQKYARLAIDNAVVGPISEQNALSVSNGFNTASDFMWAALQTDQTYAVQTGIINWTSWVSNQTTFGYTGGGTELYCGIDRRMYERISDTDWRKKMWVAPEGSPLYGKSTYPTSPDYDFKSNLPAYASLKFRPGSGNADEHTIGAATAIPIMRVEEMYFIEAEAAEHVSAGTGIQLLTNFMQTYRDPAYKYAGSDAIDEIIFQKRVELWGEGQTFFDIKRLDMSVTKGYPGTNWQDPLQRINTNGRPAWMNFVIVRTEQASNSALMNWNNPDPSDSYETWTEE